MIVALPGELFSVQGSQILIDDQPLSSEYPQWPPDLPAPDPIEVPDDTYLVMAYTYDPDGSLPPFALVPREQISGKIIFRFYPFDRFGPITIDPPIGSETSP